MASKRAAGVPVRVVILTLDAHLAGAYESARARLQRQIPGLVFSMHLAADWMRDPTAGARAVADIEKADIICNMMLFTEEHAAAVLPALRARRDQCDAIVSCLCTPDVMQLTRLGRRRDAAAAPRPRP